MIAHTNRTRQRRTLEIQSGLLFDIGLGGFVDGIVLQQLVLLFWRAAQASTMCLRRDALSCVASMSVVPPTCLGSIPLIRVGG